MANKKGFGYSFSLDTSDFTKGCKDVQKMMDKTFGKNFMNLSKGAMTALAGITAAMAGIGAAAMAMGEKLDSALTGLQGIWGSAEKATEQYERLKAIAENSSFGIETLTSVDKKIAALGVSAEESATILTRLGNTVTASNGTSQTLESMAEALTRIKVTGQVSSKSLMIFAEAGIKVDDLIGGSASDAVNKLIERMKKFDGVMKGESTDIWSQYHRVVKITEDALAKLGNYINDNFKQYVVALIDKVAELRDSFTNLLNDKDGMQALIKHIEIFAGVITAVALPAMARMAIGFLPVIKSALALIGTIAALTLIVEDLADENSVIIGGFNKIYLSFKWLSANIRESLGDLLEQALTTVSNTFVDITNYGIKAVNFLLTNVQKILNSFLKDYKASISAMFGDLAYGAALVGMESLSQKLDEMATKASKGIEINIQPISELNRMNLDEAKNLLDDLLGDSVESVENEMDEVDSRINGSIENYKNKAKEAISFLKQTFNFTPSENSSLDNNENGNVGNIVANSGKTVGASDSAESSISLWEEAKQLWNSLKESANDYYTTVKGKAEEFYTFFCEQSERIKEQKEAFQKWTEGIKSLLGEGIGQAFKEALNSSGNFFSSLGESFSKLGEQILKQIAQMVILTTLFRMLGIHSGSIAGISTVSSWRNGTMNDGVIQNGKIISTHPDDYILATKHPESLGSNNSSNIVVNVNNNKSDAEVKTNTYYDGTRQIIDIFIDGLNRDVSGVRGILRAI